LFHEKKKKSHYLKGNLKRVTLNTIEVVDIFLYLKPLLLFFVAYIQDRREYILCIKKNRESACVALVTHSPSVPGGGCASIYFCLFYHC